jgi:thioredoxin 1
MTNHLPAVTTATFDEMLGAASGTVVVDFWAEWCGPCKMLSPVLESLAEEYDGVTFVAVDSDANPELTVRYDVMSIPTLLVFRDGQPVKRLVGARPKAALLEELGELVDA